ncbi:hypothetical protein chiPu_0032914, partial [Chiloscyllium punctatum]|nr:hypothetical protein [Chiloscyllium punctatum]
MGDDPERRAVGACRRLHDQPIDRHRSADDSRRRSLCGLRGVLFPAFGDLARCQGATQRACVGVARHHRRAHVDVSAIAIFFPVPSPRRRASKRRAAASSA